MDKKELRKRYEEQDGMGKALLLEKLAFCKYADCYDFENYFRIGKLKDSELFCLVSFLYYHECFLMMLDIMNHYKEKFIFADASLLREFELDSTLMERLSRIDILTNVGKIDVRRCRGLCKKTYITEEQKKCRKEVDAFAELEDVDIVVVGVGRRNERKGYGLGGFFKRLLEEKQNELMCRKLKLVSINDAIDSSTQGGRLT